MTRCGAGITKSRAFHCSSTVGRFGGAGGGAGGWTGSSGWLFDAAARAHRFSWVGNRSLIVIAGMLVARFTRAHPRRRDAGGVHL